MLWQFAYSPLGSNSIYVDGTVIHLGKAFKTNTIRAQGCYRSQQ